MKRLRKPLRRLDPSPYSPDNLLWRTLAETPKDGELSCISLVCIPSTYEYSPEDIERKVVGDGVAYSGLPESEAMFNKFHSLLGEAGIVSAHSFIVCDNDFQVVDCQGGLDDPSVAGPIEEFNQNLEVYLVAIGSGPRIIRWSSFEQELAGTCGLDPARLRAEMREKVLVVVPEERSLRIKFGMWFGYLRDRLGTLPEEEKRMLRMEYYQARELASKLDLAGLAMAKRWARRFGRHMVDYQQVFGLEPEEIPPGFLALAAERAVNYTVEYMLQGYFLRKSGGKLVYVNYGLGMRWQQNEDVLLRLWEDGGVLGDFPTIHLPTDEDYLRFKREGKRFRSTKRPGEKRSCDDPILVKGVIG